MSIELTGPRGYEYQYLQTIYLSLLLLKNSKELQVIVEKKGGEDAEVIVKHDTGTQIFEIQVKSEQSELNLVKLTDWLSHFPDGESEENLLNRLEEDDNRFALFITQARCTDETRSFIADNGISAHTSPPFSRGKMTVFLDQLSKVFTTTTPEKATKLMKRRNEYCTQQTDKYSRNKRLLDKILKRVLIWEQMRMEKTEQETLHLLSSVYDVPRSVAPTVLLHLDKSIKDARNKRGDVIPVMQEILNEFSGSRMFTNRIHVERLETVDCINYLEQNNVLLLTGISNCGKTHLAEFISEHYRKKGFACIKEPSIAETVRFLSHASSEDRLCFLEDPFGHLTLNQDSPETLSRLHSLLSKVSSHRKLIVTSRRDLLGMLNRTTEIQDWNIYGHPWVDLSVNERTLSLLIWNAYCEEKQLPEEVKLTIVSHMGHLPNSILQPGQLRHLAHQPPSELIGKTFDELSRIARQDANALGTAFLNRRAKSLELLLITLGLCTSPLFSIGEHKLSQLLANIGEEFVEEFSSYLAELETYGYIQNRNREWYFTHPTYYEAAIFVVEHQTRAGWGQLLGILETALKSPYPKIAIHTTAKLSRLYKAYTRHEDVSKSIIEMSVKALKSPFPAVQDTALTLLLANIEVLTLEQEKEVINSVSFNKESDYHLKWEDGNPIIRPSNGVSLTDGFRRYFAKTPDDEWEGLVKRLIDIDTAVDVTPEEAWKVARGLQLYIDEETTVRLLRQLMTYNEAFIRAKTAFFIGECYGNNRELIELVFDDSHPAIIHNTIRGCFMGWKSLSQVNRNYIRDRIRDKLVNKAVCAAVNSFIIKFAKEFSAESGYKVKGWNSNDIQDIWILWSELIPIFLENIPIRFVTLNEAYLYTSISEAGNHVATGQAIILAEAWHNWINRQLKITSLDSYGSAVADFLIRFTINHPCSREHLSKQLLDHPDSHVSTVSLMEYMNNWGVLTNVEKTFITQLLNSERQDVRWLKAIALTRDSVPTEIVELLLSDQDIFLKSTADFIEILPEQLLADCIAVVTGYGVLGWLGINSGINNSYWREVLFVLINQPQHSAFPIALRYILGIVMNGMNDDKFHADAEKCWGQLCQTMEEEFRDILFSQLLASTINCVRPKSVKYWEMFFASLDENNRTKYLSTILENIEGLSYVNNIISDVIGEKLFESVLSILVEDKIILTLLLVPSVLLIEESIPLLQGIFTDQPPSLLLTCDAVLRELSHEKIQGEDVDKLEKTIRKLRTSLILRGSAKKELLREREEIADWKTVRD